MHDPLLDLIDAGLLTEESHPITIGTSEHRPFNPDDFQYDNYDWNDPEWLARNVGPCAWVPIRLSQGYFTIVLRRDFKRIMELRDGTIRKWRVNVQRDPDGDIKKVYARRCGRGDEPHTVLMHRDLARAIYANATIDHVNGWSLDNRSLLNLRRTNDSINGHNRVSTRRKHFDLPPGVEPRGKNRLSQPVYGGIRAVRKGRKKPKIIRSKRTWLNPEPAHRWYLNQLKRLYKTAVWVSNPRSLNYPLFPRRLDRPLSEAESRMPRYVSDLSVPFD